jgi:hypothetical protein
LNLHEYLSFVYNSTVRNTLSISLFAVFPSIILHKT